MPQSQYGDEEDGCIGLSSWLHYVYTTFLALCLLSTLRKCKFGQKKIKMEKLIDDDLQKSIWDESNSDSNNEAESDIDNDE